MEKDIRIKGCRNNLCGRHIKTGYQYKPSDQFCTICGHPLVFVCKRCGEPIEDEGMDVVYCSNCEEKLQKEKADRKQMVKEAFNGIPKAACALATALPVVGGLVNRFGKGDLTQKVAKAALDVAEIVNKKK